MERDNIRSKKRIYSNGRSGGNQTFGKGALAHLLQNRIFLGEITHKGASYKGEHDAIVDVSLWNDVQAMLNTNRNNHKYQSRADQPSPLAGILSDGQGRAMTPSHAKRGTKRYRYYITRPDGTDGRSAADTWRVPAGEIEPVIKARLITWLKDEAAIIQSLEPIINSKPLQMLIHDCAIIAERINTATPTKLREILLAIGLKVHLSNEAITMKFSACKLARYLYPDLQIKNHIEAEGEDISIVIPMRIARRGQELRLIFAQSDNLSSARIDGKLVGLIAKAEAAYNRLENDAVIPRSEKAHLVRLARLKFLSPDIVTAILNGKQPPLLTARKMIRATKIPLCWSEQRAYFGFD